MAATIARATGRDNTGRYKHVHRLGSHSARAEANTFRTFATAYVRADGSGYVSVVRDGKEIHWYEIGTE